MGGCTRVRKKKEPRGDGAEMLYEKVLMKGKTCYENVTQPVVVSPIEDSVSTAQKSSSARASSSAGFFFFPNAARRSGGSRAAAEVGAEGSASNDAHPVTGSRERSGTSGSGTSGSGTSGSGTFPRGASSETSRATGPASASAASASHRAATSAALGRDDGSVASACFTSALVFSLVLETTSGDHAKRPLSAASLASAPKGGRSSRSWNSRHPSAQTSAGRPTPRAAKIGWRTSHISGAR